jgi:hypothetical protein
MAKFTGEFLMLRGLLTILLVVAALTPVSASAAVSPAALIAQQLVAPGQVILTVADYTAQNDPDGLLGLPGQYVSKAQFQDSANVSGYVEVFSTARDAASRMVVLRGAAATGQEIDSLPTGSTVVLRLFNVTEYSAPAYQQACASVVAADGL